MKISTILDHIDSGYMALPKFQRGYVWNRDQVRRLMDSLYRRHPVGSLLVWVTESEGAPHRGDSPLPPGQVKLLLDGQQRMTTMYGIIRGKPPEFFDGNAKSFTGLHFNLATEEFSFFMARKMEGDPLWVDVTRLMDTGLGPFIQELSSDPQHVSDVTDYINRLNTLHSIRDIEFHAEEVTGQEKNVGSEKKRIDRHVYRKLSNPKRIPMNFDAMLKKAENKKILGSDESIYEKLKNLRKLRNRVHLHLIDKPADTDWNAFSMPDRRAMAEVIHTIFTGHIFRPTRKDRGLFSYLAKYV